jgi:putative ABC transport system substrate-binding protein
VDSLTTEETHEGIFRELGARGLAEGRDYEMKLRSAHGDMAILNGIVDAAIGDRPDLVITTSTPTLQVAVNKIKTFPVVFSTVADGVLSGAGTSDESHLPNFTGVNTMSDFEGMMGAIVECMPSARSIGTLFAPGEINSVRYRDELVRAAAKRGITVLVAAVSTTTEVSDAANALAAKRPDIIAQVTDNISSSAFPAIVAAAKKAGIPLFGFVSSAVASGAAAVVARDFSEAGAQAVRMVLRILDGEDPGRMPFESLKTSVLLLSPANAKSYGLVFPESLVKRADKVVR